jgi:DNA-binding MarR family transcriptional regulator
MSPKNPPKTDTTPAGRLVEAGLRQIVGYGIAQAAITANDVFTAKVGKPLSLRRVEYTLLMLIQENPACSASRLARALDVTAPNITMWIDKLEERGWVVREKSQVDRRSQHLRLSPKGARLATEATQRLIEGERAALARLSPAERAMLTELLHKVACCRQDTGLNGPED